MGWCFFVPALPRMCGDCWTGARTELDQYLRAKPGYQTLHTAVTETRMES